jgi:dTDP-4-dehydrorhamnose 3,5-epimerase
MTHFIVSNLPLHGLRQLERKSQTDNRGLFTRLFCERELESAGWSKPVAQINHSYTSLYGTVRGLHYQLPPRTEMKLVSCIQGAIWDVAVDLRPDSPSFLKWHAEELSAANKKAMLIPEGFAHGFQTLSDDAILIYCHSAEYSPEVERGLNPKDPYISIKWPLEFREISSRDDRHPFINQTFQGIRL